MDYYVNINIIPNSEIPEPILMSYVYQKLHNAFVKLRNNAIGVSFPNHADNLGDCLRLHGAMNALQNLFASEWLGSLSDYVSVSPVTKIPVILGYRQVRRVQSKSSPERLRRRSIKKGWIRYEDSSEVAFDSQPRFLSLPFVTLRSQSSGQPFLLFVDHGPVLPAPVVGEFSSYGLSKLATVPWF